MSTDTRNYPKISDEEYKIALRSYNHLNEEQQKPSKEEVENNIAYNLENGIAAAEKKPRGTNKTPKKKKRK